MKMTLVKMDQRFQMIGHHRDDKPTEPSRALIPVTNNSKPNKTESDDEFVDKSKTFAKNYCRNPNGTRSDLWCYTYDPEIPIESCAVPLCISKKCKMTGPGVEYGGRINNTKTGYSCLKWTDAPNEIPGKTSFPDRSLIAAGNRCRNPTGDPGGPWCYIMVDGTIINDYCDVISCDSIDCVTYLSGLTKEDSPVHGHYTTAKMAGAHEGYFRFTLKAWNPADISNRAIRIALVKYPSSSIEFLQGTGFEVIIPTDAFSATGITQMNLSWNNGLVVLTSTSEGHTKEVFNTELDADATIPLDVRYLSVSGPAAIIQYPHCTPDCEEHITINEDNYRIWPLSKNEFSGSELLFYVRTVQSATISYYTAPAKHIPKLKIVIEGQPTNQIIISYFENSTDGEFEIFHKLFDKEELVSYWQWHHYSITYQKCGSLDTLLQWTRELSLTPSRTTRMYYIIIWLSI
ncbi:uncharacterized protein LOC126903058 isoform X1 [Daktulosphaira vitifoliae]|uniref:uncharacterized protein LOC126903058 isoform X1 n=1 Tax=Daktulosphaira vitifoliae TaxID=58002 RepID=UPI0021A9D746|nr:uncharacterized protein LOC126903058 isoform X1 [Daktulosphaira vitifoliae]